MDSIPEIKSIPANPPVPVLEMRKITKSFFGVRVLKEVNFHLYAGQVHVLLGENGAGKSTLMKILSAAYSMDSGEILVDGQVQHFKTPSDAQNVGISTIYQHFSQCSHLTVAENIFLGRPPRTRLGLIDWKRINQDAAIALASVSAQIDPQTPVASLSIAQRQVVEIVSAINRKTRFLIMDEPTAALTEQEVQRLFSLIRGLTARGIGIVYISHRLEELKHIGNWVTVLRDGQNIDNFQMDNTVDLGKLIQLMIGRDIQSFEIAPLPEERPEVLRVENLTRHGKFESISFSAYQGEILGVAGLMGAGRTEVAETIFGVYPSDTGVTYLHGERVEIQRPGDALKLGLGFLTEDRNGDGLAAALSIRENMTLPMWASGQNYLHGMLLDRKLERKLGDSYSQRLHIRASDLRMPVKFLSGGNQQKVVLAKWLIAHCRILIVDEPTAGVDIGAKEEVHRLLISFVREQGGTVIMISSDLPEILKLSDRILVMSQGRLTAELTRTEANEALIMTHAVQAVRN